MNNLYELKYNHNPEQARASILRQITTYPKNMALVEVIRNSIDPFVDAKNIYVFPLTLPSGGKCLCTINDGKGLSKLDLANMSQFHGSKNKNTTGTNAAYGMGAKAASAAQSPYGTYFISNKANTENNIPYGFLLENHGNKVGLVTRTIDGVSDYIWDSSEDLMEIINNNKKYVDLFDIQKDFTAVIWLGTSIEDDPAKLDGNNWVGENLYNRFYSIRKGCNIYVDNSIALRINKKKKTQVSDGWTKFIPIENLSYTFKHTEKLQNEFSGITVDYCIEKNNLDLPFGTNHNRNGRYMIIDNNEIFYLDQYGNGRIGYLWGQSCSKFNIHPNTAKYLSIIVHLPDGMVTQTPERNELKLESENFINTSFYDRLIKEIENKIPDYIWEFNKNIIPKKEHDDKNLEKKCAAHLQEALNKRMSDSYIITKNGKLREVIDDVKAKIQINGSPHSKVNDEEDQTEDSNKHDKNQKKNPKQKLDGSGTKKRVRKANLDLSFKFASISDETQIASMGLTNYIAMLDETSRTLNINAKHNLFKYVTTLVLKYAFDLEKKQFSNSDWEILLGEVKSLCEAPLINELSDHVISFYDSESSENAFWRDQFRANIEPMAMTAYSKTRSHSIAEVISQKIPPHVNKSVTTIVNNCKKKNEKKPETEVVTCVVENPILEQPDILSVSL